MPSPGAPWVPAVLPVTLRVPDPQVPSVAAPLSPRTHRLLSPLRSACSDRDERIESQVLLMGRKSSILHAHWVADEEALGLALLVSKARAEGS